MKKVLILAYDFPPYNSVGAQRPYSWYRYFYQYGLYPIVITRQWQNTGLAKKDYLSAGASPEVIIERERYGEIHYTPYYPNLRDRLLLKAKNKIIRRITSLLTFIQVLTEHFCFYFDHKKGIYQYASNYLKNSNIDIIIATGEPFVLFRYAYLLHKKYKIPWIADYRDGWTTNYSFYSYPLIEKIIKKYVIRPVEKRFGHHASLIIAVSDGLKANLAQIHKSKYIEIVYNGYEKTDFANLKPSSDTPKKFTLAYVGSLYPYQRLEYFMKALNNYLKENPQANIAVHFFGTKIPENRWSMNKNNFPKAAAVCEFNPRMPKQELLSKLLNYDVLLLFANENQDGSCAKVFEYMALNKKILLTVRDNSTLNKLLSDYPKAHIADNINEAYLHINNLYKNKNLKKSYNINLNEYSREAQSHLFTKLIKDILIHNYA